MKAYSLALSISLLLGCKPVSDGDSSQISAQMTGDQIKFAADQGTKLLYCDSPSDTLQPKVKESAEAPWRELAPEEKAGTYLRDGAVEVFEMNEGCDTGMALHNLNAQPLYVSRSFLIPDGDKVLGEDNLAELKKIDPETKLTADSKLPSFRSGTVRFVRLDFDYLNEEGQIAGHYLREFELK